MTKTQDTVFSQTKIIDDFCFDDVVAGVFDDMVNRSVPFYREIQRMVVEQAADYAAEGGIVCDLGCATGTTLLALDESLPAEIELIGIDNAMEMLDKCQEKLSHSGSQRNISLKCEDLCQLPPMDNISVVTCVLTLQFIRPLQRQLLLSSLYKGMNKGSALILVEKTVEKDTTLNRNYIRYYYDMKRRHGYSELEISQKREALENVLIPYTLEENIQLLKDIGFGNVSIFFKWYNFCGLVALK